MVRTGRYLVAIVFGMLSVLSLLTPIGLVVALVRTDVYADLHRFDGGGAVVTLTFIVGGAAIAWAVWPRGGAAAENAGRRNAGEDG